MYEFALWYCDVDDVVRVKISSEFQNRLEEVSDDLRRILVVAVPPARPQPNLRVQLLDHIFWAAPDRLVQQLWGPRKQAAASG